MSKVPVQKGKLISNPPTMKSTPYHEKQRNQVEENDLRFSHQTLDLKEPKVKK